MSLRLRAGARGRRVLVPFSQQVRVCSVHLHSLHPPFLGIANLSHIRESNSHPESGSR